MSHNYLIIMPEITKGMKSIGPKSLIKINAQYTVLDTQIRVIKSINRRNRIFICTGFQHNRVLKSIEGYHNVTTINDKNYNEYNQCKHLINYINHTESAADVFIVNNGVLFKKDCFKRLKKNNKSTIYFTDRKKEDFEIGSESEESKYLFYGLSRKWTECVFLNTQSLKKIIEIHNNFDISKYFLFEIINMLYDKDIIHESIVSYRDIMKVNGQEDIRRAKRFL